MENLSTKHGTYIGQVSQGAPNGRGIKNYNFGCSIEGTWVKGRPEGKALFKTPELIIQVAFKSGSIKKIQTNQQSLTIRFPYKFIQTEENYEEVLDDSEKGYYSVLGVPGMIDVYHHTINRRLNIVKSCYYSNYLYLGEIDQNGTPHGFGISVRPFKLYIGYFFKGFKHGSARLTVNHLVLYKGEFISNTLNGQATEKYLKTGFKFVGNFLYSRKNGMIDVFFCDYRIECNYQNGKLINPVNFYKNGRFLVKCDVDPNYLLPLPHNVQDDLIEYIQMACAAQNLKLETFPFTCQSNKKHHGKSCQGQQSIPKKQKRPLRVILPEVNNWNSYENSLKPLQKEFKDFEFELIQRKNLENEGYIHESFQNKNFTVRYVYLNKDVYVGMVENNLRCGVGVYVKEGKIFYRGYWKNDEFHGKGELFLNEVKIIGIWNQGKLQKTCKVVIL